MPKQPRQNVSQIAVGYCRVSTPGQEDGSSLESQEEDIRAYCAAKGYPLLALYRDVQSGADLDRLGLNAAVTDIREGRAGILVVWKLDRLARNQNHQAVVLHQVEEECGGRLVSITDPLDDTAHGKFMRAALGFANEIEREKIRERMQRGLRARAESGRLNSGAVPPYGYRWADPATRTRLEPHPTTAPVVQRIFREAAAGHPIRAIMRGLDTDGVLTPSQFSAREGANGKRAVAAAWNHATIQDILRNPAYIGQATAFRHAKVKERRLDAKTGRMRTVTRFYRRDSLPADHPARTIAPVVLPQTACPPLIDAATWEAVRTQLQRNKAEATRNNKHPKDQLLRAGYAVCGYCGRNMIALSGGKQMRYICAARYGRSHNVCPGGAPTVSVELLDRDIWNKMLDVLSSPVMVYAALNRLAEEAMRGDDNVAALRSRLAAFDATLEALNRRLKNIRRQQENAIDDADYDDCEARLQEVARQQRQTQAERDDLEAQLAVATAVQALPGVVAQIAGPATQRLYLVDLDAAPEDIRAAVEEKAVTGAQGADLLRAEAEDYTYEEKRAALALFGARVEVYRKNDPQPDGTHWGLLFATEGVERVLRAAGDYDNTLSNVYPS